MATSSAVELWDSLAGEAADESPLWAQALRPAGEQIRDPVFSRLAAPAFALAIETIYEGYLVHYGRPRLFDPPDGDVALLLGDYLYAHGLVRIAETGNVGAVADLAELISICAQMRAEGRGGDGAAWAATAVLLGEDALADGRAALRDTGDAAPLERAARERAGEEPVASALAAHAGRVG